MSFAAHFEGDSGVTVGREMYELASKLYPICRSITGDGLRATLAELQHYIPLAVHEIASGTPVFDWTIPPEWTIRDAYIAKDGERIVDFHRHSLHVVSYSEPVRTTMPLDELKRHLHSLPERPDLIPYRTSYYARDWGFCLPHQQLMALEDGDYEVVIDSKLEAGFLNWGEYLKRGDSEAEILLSTHACHPSLANDNCSGMALLALLARAISAQRTRYSYRFLFAPGTIGAIAWLARNEKRAPYIRHGLVVSNVGDNGGPTYKRSRRGTAEIDRAAALVFRTGLPRTAEIRDFSPYGYDERQYCSPGFDLPIGSFQRSCWQEFPQYHTSADNLDFINAENLANSAHVMASMLDVIEGNARFTGTLTKCEPQLGKHGLYDGPGGAGQSADARMAMLWVLNLADGRHDLVDVAERAGLAFPMVRLAADRLQAARLIRFAADRPVARRGFRRNRANRGHGQK